MDPKAKIEKLKVAEALIEEGGSTGRDPREVK